MPPNHFESEVESFLEGSHGDRTHIKRADHHTVTPLCGTLLWKAAVIAGAIVFDGAVLWLLGLLLVVVFDGGSAWIAVAEWLPAHVFAALCAWGLREIIHALGSLNTADPSALASPAPQDGHIDPAHSDFRDTDALLTAPANIEADTINR